MILHDCEAHSMQRHITSIAFHTLCAQSLYFVGKITENTEIEIESYREVSLHDSRL